MNRYLPFVLLLFIPLSQAEIYKWTDGSGTVHYGDQPDAAHAKKMKNLPGLSTYAPPPVPDKGVLLENGREIDESIRDAEKKESEATPPFKYRELKIVSPENDGVLRSSPGNVSIFVAVAPVLRKGDYLKVTMDGTTLKDKYHSTVIQLQAVDRGQHTVSVSIFSEDGKKMISSSSRTFQLHRTIAK